MPSSTTSSHLSPAELSYLHTSLSSHPPIRPDARLATDFRPLNAETGVLPNTMGSAHVGFADGREAVVGVRAEVEKTARKHSGGRNHAEEDTEMQEIDQSLPRGRGKADWVTLSLTLPGLRDDDKDLIFLEETLREVLVTPAQPSTSGIEERSVRSLPDALVINGRWHWHLYIDVLLISPPETSSSSSGSGSTSASTSPLPLLSMAVHFALRDTRIPRLKSEGEEDPVADDDWEASVYLYSQSGSSSLPEQQRSTRPSIISPGMTPPVTLLVMSVGENTLFDPSATELSVADGIWAVSVSRATSTAADLSSIPIKEKTHKTSVKVLGIRMLETPARDTMKGVPRDAEPHQSTEPTNSTAGTAAVHSLGSGTDQMIPGVWKPKVGGVKRSVVMRVLKAVVGGSSPGDVSTGVGADILTSLESLVITSR